MTDEKNKGTRSDSFRNSARVAGGEGKGKGHLFSPMTNKSGWRVSKEAGLRDTHTDSERRRWSVLKSLQ